MELMENARLARRKKDISAATRAYELVGKHLGMFTDRVDITSQGKGLQDARAALDDMSPAELADLYTQSVRGELN